MCHPKIDQNNNCPIKLKICVQAKPAILISMVKSVFRFRPSLDPGGGGPNVPCDTQKLTKIFSCPIKLKICVQAKPAILISMVKSVFRFRPSLDPGGGHQKLTKIFICPIKLKICVQAKPAILISMVKSVFRFRPSLDPGGRAKCATQKLTKILIVQLS